jgi:hypothetical protein
MHHGNPIICKSVPLALNPISASNLQLPILDTLSKYNHDYDHDLTVALNAISAMGLVGAGTNNARLAQMLRQLAGYYYKEPDCLFMVRIAQGLVHMGKGTIGINPFFSDRNIMSRPAIAGLLATIMAFTDAKACESSRFDSFERILMSTHSRARQVSLDAVLPRNCHVPSLPYHARRESREQARHSSRRSGEFTSFLFHAACSVSSYPYSSRRLWTSSAKLANHERYQASKRTRRLYD